MKKGVFLTLVNDLDKDKKSMYWRIRPYNSGLESLQNEVGGYIEHCFPVLDLERRGIDAWCNDEGKLLNLPPTFPLFYEGRLYDIIAGNICFIGGDDETGESFGLPDHQIKIVIQTIESVLGAHLKVYDERKN